MARVLHCWSSVCAGSEMRACSDVAYQVHATELALMLRDVFAGQTHTHPSPPLQPTFCVRSGTLLHPRTPCEKNGHDNRLATVSCRDTIKTQLQCNAQARLTRCWFHVRAMAGSPWKHRLCKLKRMWQAHIGRELESVAQHLLRDFMFEIDTCRLHNPCRHAAC